MDICPVGKFFHGLEESVGRNFRFCEYFNRSRMEFLRAIRMLVDEK